MRTRTAWTFLALLSPALLGADLSPAPAAAAKPTKASAAAPGAEDAGFAKLVDEFYGEFPAYYPSEATALGLHAHDRELEDLSAAGVAKELAFLKGWDARFAAVPVTKLSVDNRFDVQLVRQWLAGQLFNLEKLRPHHRRPNVYVRLCSRAINALIKRDFAPAETRLAAVVARARKIPALLKVAEQNLDLMSKVSVDITLRDLDATVRFFQVDVPAAFPQVKDAKALAELKSAVDGVAQALQGFGAWLRKDGMAKATAPFQLGRELFVQKLWADEMIDEPLDSLLHRGEAELKRLQDEFRATAKKIDANKPAAQVQLDMQNDHPAVDKLMDETHARLARQRQFLIEKGIVTVPSEVLPMVKETPPFMRATSLASMDTPGPFEASKEAYYYITLPNPAWPEAEREDFLRGAYNRPLIDVVSIHEAYPGHYVQFLWGPQLSKARKFTDFSSNSEGWAHYTEQMMLDEGYGGGDPHVRLAQLQDALLRAARFVVAVRMHTQGMTQEQAVEFFTRDGFQTRQVAELEARRGTQDPLYLVYTYGKLDIYKLRAQWQEKQGKAYSLKGFHDTFLRYGRAPIKLVRAAMLGTL